MSCGATPSRGAARHEEPSGGYRLEAGAVARPPRRRPEPSPRGPTRSAAHSGGTGRATANPPRHRAPRGRAGRRARSPGRDRSALPSSSEGAANAPAAFSTSLAVLACRKVVPPPLAGKDMPCSRSVSPTADSAVSGTGFTGARGSARLFDGSVVAARRASLAAASIEPSRAGPAVRRSWPSGSRPTRARYARRTGARSCFCIARSDSQEISSAY